MGVGFELQYLTGWFTHAWESTRLDIRLNTIGFQQASYLVRYCTLYTHTYEFLLLYYEEVQITRKRSKSPKFST